MQKMDLSNCSYFSIYSSYEIHEVKTQNCERRTWDCYYVGDNFTRKGKKLAKDYGAFNRFIHECICGKESKKMCFIFVCNSGKIVQISNDCYEQYYKNVKPITEKCYYCNLQKETVNKCYCGERLNKCVYHDFIKKCKVCSEFCDICGVLGSYIVSECVVCGTSVKEVIKTCNNCHYKCEQCFYKKYKKKY